MSAATDIQRGSSMMSGTSKNESVDKLESHADPTFNSSSRGGLELECSKGEL